MKRRNTHHDNTEFLSATLSFLAVNLLWIFFALWLLYGMVPVLLLAVAMNHMINRLEVRMIRAEQRADTRGAQHNACAAEYSTSVPHRLRTTGPSTRLRRQRYSSCRPAG